MAMQRLPSDIQSLFCASTQICSYKRAVEELVYNSLDAESTSIAVRVNIEQNTIQVIDNGCGVSKCNFNLIGQRHATSKCVDLSTLKSIPNKYGYRGQSLASIIEVSQSVKITSRCQDSEETWVKSFHKGKEQKLCVDAQRPSKGTTIEVKGFLYNLKIQKKAIDSLNELNDVKAFLEQLSLVHNNISLSLRDDAKNEIIFQLHKNRDIYQTLKSMFAIKRTDLQELKVEKNNYKVSAFIGKHNNDSCQKHWVYLNGKYLQSNKLKKIVSENLVKSLKLNRQNRRKVKSKNPYDQEDELQQKGLPFYFIFITCPYYDYDINQMSKQTVVEFKDWEPINKLIEKMAKFHAGDVNLKEFRPLENQLINKQKTDDTREQVKKIMDKILGSHPKKIGISQMQNGIKGKITKRRPKPKNDSTKIFNPKTHQLGSKKENKVTSINKKEQPPLCETKVSMEAIPNKKINPPKIAVNNAKKRKVEVQKKIDSRHSNCATVKHSKRDKKSRNDEINIRRKTSHLKNKQNRNTNPKTITENTKHVHISKQAKNNKNCPKKRDKTIRTEIKKLNSKTNNILKKFAQDPTGSVIRRCNILANKVNDLMSYKKKRKRKIFINETVQYSNIVRDNKNYSIRKKIGEIIIHDYIPKPPVYNPCSFDDRVWDKTKKKSYKSTYDLMKTVLRTQETTNSCTEIFKITEIYDKRNYPENNMSAKNTLTHKNDKIFEPAYREPIVETQHISHYPRLTFESHNYVEDCNQISHNYNIKNFIDTNPKEKSVIKRFITNQSKENFVIPIINPKPLNKRSVVKLNNVEFQSKKLHKFTKQNESHQESAYTIEFSKSNESSLSNKRVTDFQEINVPSSLKEIQIENGTYTIKRNDEIDTIIGSTYTISNYCHKNGNEAEQSIDYIEDSTEKLTKHVQLSQSDNMIVGNEEFNDSFVNKITNQHDHILSENEKDFDFLEHGTENTIHSQYSPNIVLLNNGDNEKQQCEIKMNVIFISKSQEKDKSKDVEIQTEIDKQINPLNICETVLSQDRCKRYDTNHGIEWHDSLFNDEFEFDSFLCDKNAYTLKDCYEPIDANNINVSACSKPTSESKISSENVDHDDVMKREDSRKFASDLNNPINMSMMDHQIIEGNTLKKDTNHFNFVNRLRFVPKGMSQIITKGQSKNTRIYDFNPAMDYFEKAIYNDFANNIQSNCEIFEPGVQSVKELTTKAIDKVNYKLNKDNASLTFSGESLKQAKVLKQVDNKFLAAKISGRSPEIAEYLVLFDQHAVHERIRLETNLKEYFDGNEWKSIPLDDVKLRVSKDEILYLHNYKTKFMQLGLQWTVLSNNEMAINAIPLAILGKNARQVEIVMKAVKILIVEEINAIKSQSGCISLYPKAIMDLVLSEACRYAIKFGDHLSKEECADLLSSLSECKTPFQCAHGRPVMAVLMEIKEDIKKYTVNMSSVQNWNRVKKHDKK